MVKAITIGIIILTLFLIGCNVNVDGRSLKGQLENLKTSQEMLQKEKCDITPYSDGCDKVLEEASQKEEQKKQELAQMEITMPKEERKVVYSCDFTKSSCDFDVSVSTSGTSLSRDSSFSPFLKSVLIKFILEKYLSHSTVLRGPLIN